MNNTNAMTKTTSRQIIKKITTGVVISSMAVSFLTFAGCGPEVVEDYPEPIASTSEEGSTVSTSVDVSSDKGDYIEFDQERFFSMESPTFRESGKYTFDPVKIPLAYKEQLKETPARYAFAKMLLLSIYEGKKEFYIPEECDMSSYQFDEFWYTVSQCNPLAQSVSYKKIEEGHYEIIYYPEWLGEMANDPEQKVSDDYVYRQNQLFIEYIENFINSRISRSDSDEEIAEKIYKGIIEEFYIVLFTCSDDGSMNLSSLSENLLAEASADNDSGVEDHMRSVVEDYNSRLMYQYSVPDLYFFLLDQVGIESYPVTASSKYKEQYIPVLDDHMANSDWNTWTIVVMDGTAYHCDLIYDYIIYSAAKKEDPEAEVEPLFFGMSDETRKKSLEITGGSIWVNLPGNYSSAPECPEDIK